MMAQTMVNFRMDEDLKKKMEVTCKKMGLNMTTAFTIFATKVVQDQRIPFEIVSDPFYSEANQANLRRLMEDVASGRTLLKEHELIEETE